MEGPQTAKRKATGARRTRPKDFQKPSVGLPRRIESTVARGTETRQVSHSTGFTNEIPDTVESVT